MFKLFKKINVIAIAVLISLILYSCNDETPNMIGVDILDEDVFNPKRTDTVTLTAHSFLYDSITSGNLSDDQGNMLGAIYDATFGKTTTMLAAAFHLNSNSQSMDYNPVADSVEISFAYNNYYGDENYSHTIRVYELEKLLEKDSAYYSNVIVEHSNTELASITFTPSFDTVTVDGVNVLPSFKMKLDKSFGDRILSLPNGALSSNENFVEHFKGLYLEPDPVNTPNTGSFLRLALTNNQTYINIHYHNDTANNLVLKLILDKSTPRLMKYEHYEYEHASTEFKNVVINGNANTDDKLYVQSYGGVITKISMPFLDDFSTVNNIAVSDAKITFHVDASDSPFGIPATYELVRRNDDGKMVTIADFNEGTSFYGGTLASDDGTITFRITRHLQAVLSGKYQSSDLYLHVRNSAYIAGRCVLYGADNEDVTKNIKLEFTYTSIDY
ncbi:DUF4270 domain-containing protein [Bacteroidales bacterium OttesenSCG-928-K22]|nr:DUF4270 domain-containing protein [Bacteroidales bacterium OttesenSCG-928-K22]